MLQCNYLLYLNRDFDIELLISLDIYNYMNKQIRVITIVLFFSFLPYVEITKPFNGILLQKAKGYEELIKINELENADILRNLVVIPEKVKDIKSMYQMVQRINHIDRSVLTLLVNQGVKVRLFEGNLTDEPLLYYLKWNSPRGWKEDVTWEDVPGSGGGWLISAKIGASMPGSGHSSINLELHEIGHTVYRILMTDPKLAKDIQDMWQHEVKRMFLDEAYFVSYSSEYFAEMFAYYYYSKESNFMVKNKAPNTYDFFKQLPYINRNAIEQIYN